MLFENKADAEEVNSKCAFCDLDKFVVHKEVEKGYRLIRCDNDDCAVHCHGGHRQVIHQSYLNNQDTVAIASGW